MAAIFPTVRLSVYTVHNPLLDCFISQSEFLNRAFVSPTHTPAVFPHSKLIGISTD
ncbi:hypothetical protein Cp87MAT_0652 [Corynebacterium pseudotuberculosis]|nr:hypothetical protein CpPA02_1937 [Corynebacterium pseudotuberculosis]AUY57911.1 Hypothetical protein CpCAPJ4_00617 [Corynebacterium pseudotuberculosis]QBB99083.1 hypothetical protein Cp87MAT_0652 [Corynebacterium pseudotuberculosis]